MNKSIEEVKAQIEQYIKMLVTLKKEGDSLVFEVEYGRKFAKIVMIHFGQCSVHTFIDLSNGDILKAGTWKAPAPKGVRGNIFAADLGRSAVNEYGANYLR